MTNRPERKRPLNALGLLDFEAFSRLGKEHNLEPRPNRNISKLFDERGSTDPFLTRIYRAADRIITAALEWEEASPVQLRERWLGDEELRNRAVGVVFESATVSTSQLKASKTALAKFSKSIAATKLSLENLDEYAKRSFDNPEIESPDNARYPRSIEGRIINQIGPLTSVSTALEMVESRTLERLRIIERLLESRKTGRGAPQDEGKVLVSQELGRLYYEISLEVPTQSYTKQGGVPSYYGPFAPVLADIFKILGWPDLSDHYIKVAKDYVESSFSAPKQTDPGGQLPQTSRR